MEISSPIQFLDDSRVSESTSPLICYAPTMFTLTGIWNTERPYNYTLPLFMLQLVVVIAATRLTTIVLRPLRQPRFISEVASGLLLGPSILGRIPMFSMYMFPLRSIVVLEAVANLGLIYFVFTIGVELELDVIPRTGRKAVVFTTGCLAPLALGIVCALGLGEASDSNATRGCFIIFVGVALSVTAFSVIVRILAELKLLNSDVGRLAISSALINNIIAWILLTLSLSMVHGERNALQALWTALSAVVFVLLCFVIVRPAVRWVTRNTPEGEEVDELYACAILVGVLVAGLMADVIGTHSMFGAFVFGLAVPNGSVGEAVIDKIEDFINGLFLPLFFTISGLRTDVKTITDAVSALKLVAVVVIGALMKVGGCVLSAMLYQMPLQEGLELGLLMNTKGLVELVILNLGKDKHILNDQSFTILILISILITAVVSPLLNSVAKSSRRFVAYKRRTVRWSNPESELRVLACIHHPRDVPSLITLLDISNPTKRSPIFVYALHLIELTGHATTLLVNSAAPKDSSLAGGGGAGKVQMQSEQVVHALETYEQHAGGVSVQTITAFSPYQTMHQDICGIAEDKHAALILVPFHKHQTVDGFMEVTHPSIRSLNQNVIASAPCSIGILIDRGLSSGGGSRSPLRIGLIFLGGPDDRESLAYAGRMAGHPNISLSLLRFVPGLSDPALDQSAVAVTVMHDREQCLDEACLEELKMRWAGREIYYREKVSRNAEETVEGIREMVEGVHDLYIVGRGYKTDSPLTAGLTEWSECPELGPIGDLLSTSDFSSGVSVLVVQQGTIAEGVQVPDSPGRRHVKLYVNKPGQWM